VTTKKSSTFQARTECSPAAKILAMPIIIIIIIIKSERHDYRLQGCDALL